MEESSLFKALRRLSRGSRRMNEGLLASSVRGGPRVYSWKLSHGITKDRNVGSRIAPFSEVPAGMVPQRSACGPLGGGGGAAHRYRLCAACRISTRGRYLLGHSPTGCLCFVRLVTTVDRQSRRCGVRDCRCDSGTARVG